MKMDLVEVDQFWDNSSFRFVRVNSSGRSGGLLCLWNPLIFGVIEVVKDRSFIMISSNQISIQERVNFVNVYALNNFKERLVLWNALKDIKNNKMVIGFLWEISTKFVVKKIIFQCWLVTIVWKILTLLFVM